MGTTLSVIVVGDGPPARRLVVELASLERVWTRFRPTSELSRMNAAAGDLTVVSADLYVLLEHLVAARDQTGGRFDPTLGSSMIALGYDRTFWSIHDDGPVGPIVRPSLNDGAQAIELVPSARAVLLAPGVRIDPGGLGKGLAGDLVAAQAMAAGADGVLIDLGGDIVVRGVAPEGGAWRIDVPGLGGGPGHVVELNDGAVATSDTTVRTWTRGGVRRSHVLDPAVGSSVEADLRATVVAGAGWWAEAAATAALISTARGDGWVDALEAGGSVAGLWVGPASTEVEPASAAAGVRG